ncbi:unnamed protein product [Adineta steineri]|uniref:G-protein coupled receptors family 1 profile domain-containing protein n=1 Tax=Adineta steineri TaxID=433720 RepID=A0A818TQN3_9BILA|nr:unnamed protein product [Adineta steineri]CAF3690534.1 unnamed protein product [Adineta steineri]
MSTTVLAAINVQGIRILHSIFIGMGNLGTVINLFIFLREKMRKQICSLFFIGYLITNFGRINFYTLLPTLNIGFGIDIFGKYPGFCPYRRYLGDVLLIIPNYLLVCASLDRMLFTSSNANTRSRMNRRLALFLIGGNILFWSLFNIYLFFFSQIQVLNGISTICYVKPGVGYTFYTFHSLIDVETIPILLMTGFGIQTIRHVKQMRVRSNLNFNKRDRNFITILSIQVVAFIILRLPNPIYYLYEVITSSTIKSSNRVAIENFVFFIVSLLGHAEGAAFPWINLMTSGSRTELKQAINYIIQKIHPRAIGNTTTASNVEIEGQNIQRTNNNINAIAPI